MKTIRRLVACDNCEGAGTVTEEVCFGPKQLWQSAERTCPKCNGGKVVEKVINISEKPIK